MPFEKVLFGMGIRYVGETVAKKLVAYFKNIDALINASVEELTAVDEIGTRIGGSLVEYWANPQHIEQIEKLRAQGLQLVSEAKEVVLASESLSGKTSLFRVCSRPTRVMSKGYDRTERR